MFTLATGFPRNVVGGDGSRVTKVGKDLESRMFLAHVVPLKSAGVGWICDRIVEDLKKCVIGGWENATDRLDIFAKFLQFFFLMRWRGMSLQTRVL